MTDSTLKALVVLDPETQLYKPAGHNLSAADAVHLVQQFSEENRTAKVIDQDRRHRSSFLPNCRSCQKAAATAAENSNDHLQPVEPVAS
jgi:hypothetical protein